MSKLKKRSGFSIVEVVIALAVIVIVSTTALSIVLSSAATRVNAVNRSNAINFADNVWECFKAADDQEDFHNLLYFSEEIEPNANYIYSTEEFTADFDVDFDTGYFEIEVTDKDGDEIIKFNYTKATKGGEA